MAKRQSIKTVSDNSVNNSTNNTLFQQEDSMSINLNSVPSSLKALYLAASANTHATFEDFAHVIRENYLALTKEIIPAVARMKTEVVENKDIYKTIMAYVASNMRAYLKQAEGIVVDSMTRWTYATSDKCCESLATVLDKDSTKLIQKLILVGFAEVVSRVNDNLHDGMKLAQAIGYACYISDVDCMPAEIRNLLNACTIFPRKGSQNLTIWFSDEAPRNSAATHGIAEGVFVQCEDGMEYLIKPEVTYSLAMKDSKDDAGESIRVPKINYWTDKGKNTYTKALAVVAFMRKAYQSSNDTIMESLLSIGCPIETITYIFDKETEAAAKQARQSTKTPKATAKKSTVIVSEEEASEIDSLLDF